MRIFKFGGASIQTIERMKSTGAILKNDPREKMLLVISAMGKRTNALEKVAESFFSGNSKEALSLFNRVKQ